MISASWKKFGLRKIQIDRYFGNIIWQRISNHCTPREASSQSGTKAIIVDVTYWC